MKFASGEIWNPRGVDTKISPTCPKRQRSASCRAIFYSQTRSNFCSIQRKRRPKEGEIYLQFFFSFNPILPPFCSVEKISHNCVGKTDIRTIAEH